MALATGWTMNQVREHSLNDIDAMTEALKVRARKQRVASLRGRMGR